MGKLSDLAFVVFASPLLAFLLSLVVPDRARWERAAYLSAYVGLPLLYAAFNTFGAVHDPIIGALSLVRGGPTYSPLDVTDSLVIPPGLALAFWVWRRPVPAAAVRQRLVLLVAAVAGLASIATSGPETERGVRFDGSSVETPTGVYSVNAVGVFRDGQLEYSTLYLREDENIWLQVRDTRHLEQRYITLMPYGITFDPDSGEVIVGMGVQGVLIGSPDGRWTLAGAEGRFRPTDFSALGKAEGLLTDAWFWVVALGLSSCALVVGMLIADFRQNRLWTLAIGFAPGAGVAILTAIVLSTAELFATANQPVGFVILALVVGFVPITVVAALGANPRVREAMQYGLRIPAFVLTALAVQGFGHYPEPERSHGPGYPEPALSLSTDFVNDGAAALVIATMAGFLLAISLVVASWARSRYWRSAVLAFLAVLGSVVVAFMWWLQLDAALTFSKIAAGLLVALIGVTFGLYLRWRERVDPPRESRRRRSPPNPPPFLRPG